MLLSSKEVSSGTFKVKTDSLGTLYYTVYSKAPAEAVLSKDGLVRKYRGKAHITLKKSKASYGSQLILGLYAPEEIGSKEKPSNYLQCAEDTGNIEKNANCIEIYIKDDKIGVLMLKDLLAELENLNISGTKGGVV